MLDTMDFYRNPAAPEFGDFGICQVRYGKAMRGSPPRRRSRRSGWCRACTAWPCGCSLQRVRVCVVARAPFQLHSLVRCRGAYSCVRTAAATEMATTTISTALIADAATMSRSWISRSVEPRRMSRLAIWHITGSTMTPRAAGYSGYGLS